MFKNKLTRHVCFEQKTDSRITLILLMMLGMLRNDTKDAGCKRQGFILRAPDNLEPFRSMGGQAVTSGAWVLPSPLKKLSNISVLTPSRFCVRPLLSSITPCFSNWGSYFRTRWGVGRKSHKMLSAI